MIIVYIKDAPGRRKWGVHRFFFAPWPRNRLAGDDNSYSLQTLSSARACLELAGWPKASIDRLIDLARKHPVPLADI